MAVDEILSGASWAEKKCLPCKGQGTPFNRGESEKILSGFPYWELSGDAKSIRVRYRMKNFTAAVRLIDRIAEIAESEDHHPDIHLTGYRKLSVEVSTHAIGGLSNNDFILAAKIDALPKELSE